jgi:hypothetical protein
MIACAKALFLNVEGDRNNKTEAYTVAMGP